MTHNDTWTIGDRTFNSRLIVGTGKYASIEQTREAIQLSDEPLLDELVQHLVANEYRINYAIERIVQSDQFRTIRGREFAMAGPAAAAETDRSTP